MEFDINKIVFEIAALSDVNKLLCKKSKMYFFI